MKVTNFPANIHSTKVQFDPQYKVHYASETSDHDQPVLLWYRSVSPNIYSYQYEMKELKSLVLTILKNQDKYVNFRNSKISQH